MTATTLHPHHRRAALCFGVAACALVPLHAGAQAYPAKTVRMIVPFAAGGGTDIIARLVAQKLTESLGQTFIVDNRAGANGIIGTELVAKAPPDGYTILLGTTATHAINISVYSKLPYDPVKDFAPITNLAYSAFIISVHPSIPARSIKELVALAKARPGQISYASAGMGNSTHLAGELFCMLAGIKMVHVPYKGSGPAMVDTVAGQTAATFDSMQASVPHIRTNRLRPLAITATTRSPVLPDLPTIGEAGVPGAEAGSWYAMFAPAATPRPIVLKLNAEIIKALALPDVRDRLATVGVDPIGNSPEQFATELQSEILKWGKTARIANVRTE
jgi:tripartite-type tricarboxylate transporter receptor subunit TctC